MNDASLARRGEYLSLLTIPVYVLLCLALLPYFREIIDPDDTNYLKIAERYASGDWHTAINGMWSPLNSWIGALFLATGVKGILLFKYLNIAFGCIVLAAIRKLLQKSGLDRKYHFIALAGLIPFALYATYHELAADWLQCMIILLYLNLIFSPKYPTKTLYPLLCGVLGALAYYAKYYNFHFFWLSFIVLNFYWFYRKGDSTNIRKFWTYTTSGVFMLILCAIPWIVLLHGKYHFWKLNYTGAYDLAWSLNPELVTSHVGTLLPPTLPGAASYLEDPIWLKHDLVTPFSSMHYFLRQVGVSCVSVVSFLEALSFFSALLPAVLAVCIFRFFRNGKQLMSFETGAALVMITMPLGYFVFHVEPRFIWPIFILGYIIGVKLLVNELFPLVRTFGWRLLILSGFMVTCMLRPAIDLVENFRRDDDETAWARAISEFHLQGKIIANGDQNKVIRMAYLAKLSLAVHTATASEDGLIRDIEAQRINYYFEFYGAQPLLSPAITSQLSEVTVGKFPFMRIYRLY